MLLSAHYFTIYRSYKSMSTRNEPAFLNLFIRARQQLGKNQSEFAKLLGCSQPVLSRYESGARAPGLNILAKLHALSSGDLRGEVFRAMARLLDADSGVTWDELEHVINIPTRVVFSREGGRRFVRLEGGAAVEWKRRQLRLIMEINEILNSGEEVHADFLRIVGLFRKFGSTPSGRAVFQKAADYLEVSLTEKNGTLVDDDEPE